jgi:uncharacterized membrane protein HdeD (DUF308 family)
MAYGPPWKLAVIGAVAVIAGVALVLVDWTLPELAAFVAMLLVARGALHIVTTDFEGVNGALAALLGCSEVGVGIVLLAWPSPTELILVLLVGVLVLVRDIVEATIVLATRADRRHWRLRFAVFVLEIALAVTLIARPFGTVRATAIVLGVIAMLSGVVEIAVAFMEIRSERRAGAHVRSAVAVS